MAEGQPALKRVLAADPRSLAAITMRRALPTLCLAATAFFGACDQRAAATTMKVINYRGGLVEFRIPTQWQEKYLPAGGGEFWDPKGGSATLRLQVLTVKKNQESLQKTARDFLCDVVESRRSEGWKLVDSPSGDAMAETMTSPVEQGQVLRMYSWMKAGDAPQDLVRLAQFTFTVLDSEARSNAARVDEDLAWIRTELGAARISKLPGAVPK